MQINITIIIEAIIYAAIIIQIASCVIIIIVLRHYVDYFHTSTYSYLAVRWEKSLQGPVGQ